MPGSRCCWSLLSLSRSDPPPADQVRALLSLPSARAAKAAQSDQPHPRCRSKQRLSPDATDGDSPGKLGGVGGACGCPGAGSACCFSRSLGPIRRRQIRCERYFRHPRHSRQAQHNPTSPTPGAAANRDCPRMPRTGTVPENWAALEGPVGARVQVLLVVSFALSVRPAAGRSGASVTFVTLCTRGKSCTIRSTPPPVPQQAETVPGCHGR